MAIWYLVPRYQIPRYQIWQPCFQATCATDDLCLPTTPDADKAAKLKDRSLMVLVRTSSSVLSWTDVDPGLIDANLVPASPTRDRFYETPLRPKTLRINFHPWMQDKFPLKQSSYLSFFDNNSVLRYIKAIKGHTSKLICDQNGFYPQISTETVS
jgi:hypothetical protein